MFRRRCSLFGVSLAFLVGAAAARGDDDFVFLGPSPARNFQPIQLVFLNLPFETAATLRRGEVEFRVESAEINEIATTTGPIESRLKFETNRTVLGGRYGVADGWEVGLELPFLSRFGGFQDQFIDFVEGLFGAGNPERDWWPNNSFGGFSVKKDGTALFVGHRQYLEVGDLMLEAKREFDLGERWPVLAGRAAVKFPTGREGGVFGSGKPDFGIGAAADYRVHRRVQAYLNLNLVYPVGPVTAAELTLNPIFTQSFAVEVGLWERFSVLLHQAVYTSPFHGTDTRLLDGTPVEIGLGLNLGVGDRVAFQLLAIDNVSPVEPAADFTLLLTGRVRL